jgi:hypothetical protein
MVDEESNGTDDKKNEQSKGEKSELEMTAKAQADAKTTAPSRVAYDVRC